MIIFPGSFRPIALLLFSLLFSFYYSHGQSYNYSVESFEENIWANASSTFTEITASTGKWTVAKDNVQSSAVPAFSGNFSLHFKNKNAALMSPRLDNGAGVLTFQIMRTSNRTIMVETSVDQATWVNVDTYTATSGWTLRTVTINDPAVRYIRFSSNSNSGLYIDDVLITSAGAPGVTTVTATPSDISQTSAVVGGTITSGNMTTITSRGVCYDDAGSPDINSLKVEVPGTTGTFSATLTGLSIGKTYYVKAYAQTPQGISYGLVVPFTTRAADAPVTYWTQPFNDAAEFPATQPTSPVTIHVPGQGDWIYFNAYRSTSPLYITDGSVSALRLLKNGSYVVTPVLEDGVSFITFSEGRGGRTLSIYTSADGGATWTMLQDLETERGKTQAIHINSADVNRIKIANNSGSDADIDNLTATVFPSGDVPVLTTSDVTNIGKNSASVSGEVTGVGSKPIAERGFVWNTRPSPILADHKLPNGTGMGAYTSTLADLPAGSTIYVRAYATSRAGTGYGNERTFTTLPATLPVITTTTATEVKGELATSGGNITDNGGAEVTQRGICWNTTGNPTINDNKSIDGSGSGVFEGMLVHLAENTTYYYRAYATNSAGTGYGETFELTTVTVSLPAVTTAPVSSVFSYKAVGGGTVTNDGDGMTEMGLCWNTTGNPTIADNKVVCGNGQGFHEGTMNGLTENFQYYVKAYATNSKGTVYGEEISFSTPVSTAYSKPIGFAEGTTGGGTPTPDNTIIVRNAAELAAAISGPKSVILVEGTITTGRVSGVFRNKSIIGLPGARLINLDQTKSGSGIFYLSEGSRNVIIQNLIFEGPGAYDVDGYDLLSNKGCYKLWVDHCEFQDGTDGNFDNSNESDSITTSWCKFTYLKPPRAGGPGGSPDHRFSNLIGGSDSDAPQDGHYSTTWQNCWWAQGVKARMVRARNGEIHLLNCYWNSPETADAIGITAGTFGTTVYVEGGVFDLPPTAKVSDLGPGQISIQFKDCIGGASDYGTVAPPTYEYIAMPPDEVVAAITNPVCGAGATLYVTQTGEVYSGCPAVPILEANGKLSQEVYRGSSIEDIVFTWSGTATDVTVAGLPAGLTTQKDLTAKTFTVSGIPTSAGTFTVSTLGGAGLPASRQVAITITDVAPPALQYAGYLNQSVSKGSAITNIVFTWSGGATDATVSGLPEGITATKNTAAKTLTLHGTPALYGSYTVTTEGGSGDPVTFEGTIQIVYSAAKYKIAYVTNSAQPTYAKDSRILPALKADPNFDVTEINAGMSGNDYSSFDLVVFSEVAGSEDPGVLELRGLNKPFVMMKVHSYKNAAAAWSWADSETAYDQSATETKLAVLDKTHSIFAGLTYKNENEIDILTTVDNLKGITYMDPAQFKNVSGGVIKSLATIPGEPDQVSILEIPAGTTVAGTPINKPFIQIGINSSSFAQVTKEGIAIIRNACLYLLGNELVEPPAHMLISTANISQTVDDGESIVDMVFTWGGGASDVTLSDLPPGLSASRNMEAKIITISGKPDASGNFTVTTTGNRRSPVVLEASVTVRPLSPTLVSSGGSLTQTIDAGMSIAPMVFTWGKGATGVDLTALPPGLIATVNETARTLTISGQPAVSGSFTVTTTGGASPAVSLQGTIIVRGTHAHNEVVLKPSITMDHTFVAFEVAKEQVVSIAVADARGRTVLQKVAAAAAGRNNIKIEMRNFRPGLYFVTLRVEGRSKVVKLVKL